MGRRRDGVELMASNIDPTKPSGSIAYTADVRANFASAKDEIEALQAQAVGQVAPYVTMTGSWDWTTTAATPPLNNKLWWDQSASTIVMSAIANGGRNFGATLRQMRAGDNFYLWDPADSARWGKWSVTADAIDNGSWFQFAVAPLSSGTGGQPNNNADVEVVMTLGGLFSGG